MELGFPKGDSLIHRLDPRLRIVAAALLSVMLAVAQRPAVLVTGLAAGIVMAAMARLSPKRFLWHLLTVNGFMLLLWVALPFATPGARIAALGPFRVSAEGLAKAGVITLRCNALLMAAIALLATLALPQLGYGLQALGMPRKLAHIFMFTARYFDVLHGEYHRLTAALKVRRFRPGFNRHTCRTYGYLAGMLLVNSFHRADRVLDAMKCRGFRRRFHVLHEFAPGRADAVFACAAAALLLLLGWMEWTTRL